MEEAGTNAEVSTTFVVHYVFALLVLALSLFGLKAAVGRLTSGRVASNAEKHVVSVVDSTLVAPNTSLHIVKIADKFYALGGGSGHLTLLCEVPAANVTPWLKSQRKKSD